MTTPNIMTKAIITLGGVFIAIFAASRFIDGIHTFLSKGSIISLIELYLILLNLGIIFYQNLKMNLMEVKFKKVIDGMHKIITTEYEKFVTQKIERIETMIIQGNEDIKEIKDELKNISKNILDLAKR